VVDGSGEPPKTSSKASDSAAASDDLGGWPTDLPVKGVFGADDADVDLTASVSDPLEGLAGDADRVIDASMPSALSAAGSTRAAGRGATSAAAGAADDARSVASGVADRAKGLADGARSGAGGLADGARSAASDATAAMPSAFPDTDGRPGDNSFPSWTAAKSDVPSSIDETLAMGPMAGGRGSRTAGRSGQGAADRRPTQGIGQSAGPGSRAAGSQRLQETEIKLAGRQAAPEKPREPNRVLLGLALALVVLAGAAVAWWLTRDDGAEGSAAGEVEQAAETTTTLAAGDAAAAPEPEAPAVEEPVLDVPTLSLLDVEPGPLDSETTYSLDLFGEPAGSMLQVIVDDVPQGQPDVLLPDLILPAGRHTLVVNVTDGAGTRLSSPIEVYVLDAPPAQGTLANLASIDMVNEGWDEAIRRFDEYRAAGHQNLRLLPITPGFWNIFVADQVDAAAVATYCEGFGLGVPDDCFAKDFDPATYQGPAPAAAPAAGDGTDTADDGSMTDTDDGAMTDEGGTDTSTSTTTGG